MKPIVFEPLYKERIWGGRRLETVYNRTLPSPNLPYGEAWEIVDRPDEQSIVSGGEFHGKSLHHLWTLHRDEIFGKEIPPSDRFPILVKILDSATDLSIQVHPPADIAPSLQGEPKTEMWFIARADPGSRLHVGLKNGVTRESFAASIANGTVAAQVHSIIPSRGDSIFIPSGRLHAIGGGFLIHEIQQNSDSTYRVFDWNRLDPAGKPRDLHVAESMACIDFSDIEPEMDMPDGDTLASCPHFKTTLHFLKAGESISNADADRFSLITVVSGSLASQTPAAAYSTGSTILLPPACTPLVALEPSSLLRITSGHR